MSLFLLNSEVFEFCVMGSYKHFLLIFSPDLFKDARFIGYSLIFFILGNEIIFPGFNQIKR